LIDCDSFQIRDVDLWRLCEVGVAHFTPPDLQGASFRGVVRTPNHDAFGLAVLIFHLLFMGRHPFAGRYGGRGDMPLEQAIREYRFAFGRNAAAVQMAPPPDALPLVSASDPMAALFERAFRAEGAGRGGRPSAAAWVAALDRLRGELTTCSVSRAHRYHKSLTTQCPWCAIERDGGPDFFASVIAAMQASAGGFDLQAVWAAIIAQPAPERSPALPSSVLGTLPSTLPVPWGRRLAWRAHRWLGIATFLGAGVAFVAMQQGRSLEVRDGLALVGCGIVSLVLRQASRLREEHARRKDAVRAARGSLLALETEWRDKITKAADGFAAHQQELTAYRIEYLGLDAAKQAERQQLDAQREARQRQKYLELHFIASASLTGIGPGLTATLASYGIETAADVEAFRICRVPGFGTARVSTLTAWRYRIESKFKYDPRQRVDATDLAAFEQRFTKRKVDLERMLVAGPADLRRLARIVEQIRERLGEEIVSHRLTLAVAEANLTAAT